LNNDGNTNPIRKGGSRPLLIPHKM
jgi:hypothetical protein